MIYAPAADLTATYRAPAMSMRIEIAANGDIRGEMSVPGMYLIRHAGRSYLVMQRPEGPLVEDVEDVAAVMQEEMKTLDPHFCDHVADGATGTLAPRGKATVAGYEGEAYGFADRPNAPAEIVISRSPELAPLAAAMATQFRMSTAMMGGCAPRIAPLRQMQALLDNGAPLQIGPMRLEKVETGPVDPAPFVLPAAPATREQVRSSMKKGPTVTLEPRPAN